MEKTENAVYWRLERWMIEKSEFKCEWYSCRLRLKDYAGGRNVDRRWPDVVVKFSWTWTLQRNRSGICWLRMQILDWIWDFITTTWRCLLIYDTRSFSPFCIFYLEICRLCASFNCVTDWCKAFIWQSFLRIGVRPTLYRVLCLLKSLKSLRVVLLPSLVPSWLGFIFVLYISTLLPVFSP